MAVENVRIVYSIEDSEIESLITKFGKLSNEEKEQLRLMQQIDKQATQTVSNQNAQYNGLNKTISNIRNTIITAFAVDKILSFGKEVLNTTATFQKFEAVLTNTLGSNSNAQKAIQMLTEFAAKTPFSVEELTGSFVKLANAGFKPTALEMEKLGDLASSTGKSFDQLAEAILDAQTGEFERLKEFGVRANKEGDNVRFTFKGVETQVKGTEAEIRKYVLSLGSLQGVSGSMSAISKTLGGQISNLGDSFQQLQLAVGGLGEKGFSVVISGLNNAIQGLTKFIVGNKEVKSNVDLATDAVLAQKMELNQLVKAIRDENISNDVRLKLVDELNTKFPEFAKSIDIVKASEKDLEKALKEVNKQFDLQVFNVAKQEIVKETQKKREELQRDQIQLIKDIETTRDGYIMREGKRIEVEKRYIESDIDIYRKRMNVLQRNEKDLETLQELQLDKFRKYLDERGLSENEANKQSAKNNNTSITIDKKAQEELAKQRAEFSLREIEAQQKLAEEKIQNQIKNNDALLSNESLGFEEKVKIIRDSQELELSLIKLQAANSLQVYEIDKNNQIILKKQTESEKAIISNEAAQKEIELQRKTQNELSKLELESVKKLSALTELRNGKLKEVNIDESLLDRIKENADKRIEIAKNAIDKEIKMIMDRYYLEIELEKEKEARKKEIQEKAGELASSILNSAFQISQNNREAELQDIEKKKQYELSLAQGNKSKEIEINQKFAEREREIKNKQAIADKNKAIFDVAINTASNIVKVFPNALLMALAAGIGISQGAAIASKPLPKFRKGTDYLDLPSTGIDPDGIIAEVHQGERIVPTHINKEIKHIPNFMLPDLLLNKKEVRQEIDYNKLAQALGNEIKQIPINSISINENGFEKWVYENGNTQKVINKNNSF